MRTERHTRAQAVEAPRDDDADRVRHVTHLSPPSQPRGCAAESAGAKPLSESKAAADTEPMSESKAAADTEPMSESKAAADMEPLSEVLKQARHRTCTLIARARSSRVHGAARRLRRGVAGAQPAHSRCIAGNSRIDCLH